MGIDTVVFIVPSVKLKLSDRTRMLVVTPDAGEVVKNITNRKRVPGKYGKHSVHIRSDYLNSELRIEGALHGFSFGQNHFTSNNLRQTCFRTIRAVRKIHPFEVSDDAKKRWLEGDIKIENIHISYSFKFNSDEEVNEILKQIGTQLHQLGKKVSSNTYSVNWAPRNGRNFSITFYNKGPQMRVGKLVVGEAFERLRDECTGVLRVELRLKHHELEALELDRLGAWNKKTPRTVFLKYFSRVPLLNVTWGGVTKDQLQNIPKTLRTALILHLLGADLKVVYSAGHVNRLIAKFNKLGIDIRCKNQEAEAIMLNDLLSENRLVRVPDWIKNSDLWP